MARQYSPTQFFRRVPNALLGRYFHEKHNVLLEIAFDGLRETGVEPIFKAFAALPPDQQAIIEAEMQDLDNMACQSGMTALTDEADFHGDHAFPEALAKIEGFHGKVMWALLEHSKYWAGATMFLHSDNISDSQWKKRNDLPHLLPKVEQQDTERLAEAISHYFYSKEGRGRNCKVEVFRRHEKEYFFAYPEDFAQSGVKWVRNTLSTRARHPAFEIIFVFCQNEGSLDIYAPRNTKSVPQLQQLFVDTILGVDELILRLGSKGDCTLGWEQVREWPKGTISILQEAGWIKPKTPARTVVCSGCEENCFMPVHFSPAIQEKPMRAFVACDKRDDMGRIPIAPNHLQQWQVTERQVAGWISLALAFKGKPKKDKTKRIIQLGNVQGKKQAGILELDCTQSPDIKISGRSVPLREIIFFNGKELKIDRATLVALVDRPVPSDSKARYQPSKIKREARKQKTQEMYKSWQKAYRELKKNRRNMSDVWYSQQIAKMDISKSRDTETIRKHMRGSSQSG